MLKNDESFWKPSAEQNGASLSWSSSEGDFTALWMQTQRRWQWITKVLAGRTFPLRVAGSSSSGQAWGIWMTCWATPAPAC